MPRLFHFCAVANRLEQYEAMRASFVAAGFDDSVCRYTLFDNSAENLHDPYAVLTAVCRDSPEPYVVWCHQDVLAAANEVSPDRLARILSDLDAKDPTWAIAGNAGINSSGNFVGCITDPKAAHRSGRYPARVMSLDENFLVIRRDAGLRCSEDLRGFHLYAADLCLEAAAGRHNCYVIDFHLTHLSAGNAKDDSFARCAERLAESWNRRMLLCSLETPTRTVFRLSRFPIVRRWLADWSFVRRTRKLGYAVVPSGRTAAGFVGWARDLGVLAMILVRVALLGLSERLPGGADAREKSG